MSNSWANLSLGVDENPRVNMAISGANYNQPYELPTMSTTLKGGAKVGEGLAIDENEQLNIEDGAIAAAKLDDGAVTTPKIADGAVTSDKIDVSVIDLFKGNVKAFDTVADMQAATLEAGDVCHTNGFHASDDGGAAFYKITASGTANGMDVLACGGVFANLVYDATVNIKQLGAYGDNTHDDYNCFIRAITLIYQVSPLEYVTSDNPRGGGVVYIPNGMYKVDTAITSDVLVANISFVGESLDAVIKANPFVNLDQTGNMSSWNIRFYSLTFIGNGISIIAPYGGIIENCKFYDASEYGIRFYLTVATKVINCYFCNCYVGLVVNGSAGVGPSTTLLVDKCWFSHCTSSALFLRFNDNYFITSKIANCIFEYNNRAIYAVGNATNASFVTIENAHFENNTIKSTFDTFGFKITDSKFDTSDTFEILTNAVNEYYIECDDSSKFVFNNLYRGKVYIKGKNGFLFNTFFGSINEMIRPDISTWTIPDAMIATKGSVIIEYMSNEVFAHAEGTFVRGTAFTLTDLVGHVVSNAYGVVAITDENGTNKRLRIKWR